MTLTTFVRKNAFRNKRRTFLTMMSIAFPLLLLSFLMSIWRAFYADDLRSEQSNQRLTTRHKVSLTNLIPSSYREKTRYIPAVTRALPMNQLVVIHKHAKP